MAAATLESGVYFIQNFGTGTVIDLENGSSANGTKVQGYTKRELKDSWVPAQLWVITQVGSDNVYSIQNANSRSFLDLTGSASADGTPVIGFQGTGNGNQKWIITRNTKKNAYVISSVATGTYVDLRKGGTENGTQVQCWSGGGAGTQNANQLWLIVRA